MTNMVVPEEMWHKVEAKIANNSTFTITSHVNPDGDAVGSELALYNFLISRNKKVKIINNNPLPVVFNFLVDSPDLFCVFEDDRKLYQDWIGRSDVIFILDISNPDRLSRMNDCVTGSPAYKICIDHHEGNDLFADLNIINESACATAELMYEALTVFNYDIDIRTATALYIAIVTDTGSFSHSNTGENAHLIASKLIGLGVKPGEIYKKIYESNTWQRTDLFQQALSGLKRDCNGKLVWMKITEEMVATAGAMREELEGFVDYPLSIVGVELSLLFLEVKGKGTKISLRSKNFLNVHKFALQFGGGGHKHAAGIRMYDVEIDNAVDQVIEKAREIFVD